MSIYTSIPFFLKKNKVYFISEYRAESRCFKIISPQIVVWLAKR
jgi:hypothetical protein